MPRRSPSVPPAVGYDGRTVGDIIREAKAKGFRNVTETGFHRPQNLPVARVFQNTQEPGLSITLRGNDSRRLDLAEASDLDRIISLPRESMPTS